MGQRTKDAAESARLNSLVSEQEKKIKTICQELGKLYLSLHGPEDCEPALADYVKEAGECYQKIADLREKIRVLKGLRQCPHCGAQIPAGTAYCGSCGKRVDEAPIQEDNAKRCGVCGSILREGLMFCTSCGAPVLAAEAAGARQQESSAPSPAGQEPSFPEQEPWPRPVPPCRRDLQRSRMLLQTLIRGGSPLPPCRKDLLKILFLPRSRCRTAVRTAGVP